MATNNYTLNITNSKGTYNGSPVVGGTVSVYCEVNRILDSRQLYVGILLFINDSTSSLINSKWIYLDTLPTSAAATSAEYNWRTGAYKDNINGMYTGASAAISYACGAPAISSSKDSYTKVAIGDKFYFNSIPSVPTSFQYDKPTTITEGNIRYVKLNTNTYVYPSGSTDYFLPNTDIVNINNRDLNPISYSVEFLNNETDKYVNMGSATKGNDYTLKINQSTLWSTNKFRIRAYDGYEYSNYMERNSTNGFYFGYKLTYDAKISNNKLIIENVKVDTSTVSSLKPTDLTVVIKDGAATYYNGSYPSNGIDLNTNLQTILISKYGPSGTANLSISVSQNKYSWLTYEGNKTLKYEFNYTSPEIQSFTFNTNNGKYFFIKGYYSPRVIDNIETTINFNGTIPTGLAYTLTYEWKEEGTDIWNFITEKNTPTRANSYTYTIPDGAITNLSANKTYSIRVRLTGNGITESSCVGEWKNLKLALELIGQADEFDEWKDKIFKYVAPTFTSASGSISSPAILNGQLSYSLTFTLNREDCDFQYNVVAADKSTSYDNALQVDGTIKVGEGNISGNTVVFPLLINGVTTGTSIPANSSLTLTFTATDLKERATVVDINNPKKSQEFIDSNSTQTITFNYNTYALPTGGSFEIDKEEIE